MTPGAKPVIIINRPKDLGAKTAMFRGDVPAQFIFGIRKIDNLKPTLQFWQVLKRAKPPKTGTVAAM